MIAMLPVRVRESLILDRSFSFDNACTMHFFPAYHTNPALTNHSYVKDLFDAGITGVRETALQIIKERLYVSRSLRRS